MPRGRPPSFSQCIDEGINFIDTANIYGRSVSEQHIGETVKGVRSQVLIATKVSGAMGDGPNDKGNSRYHIMEQVEASLRRLQTDYIDLYQIHFTDASTPIEETLRALDDLVRQGKGALHRLLQLRRLAGVRGELDIEGAEPQRICQRPTGVQYAEPRSRA